MILVNDRSELDNALEQDFSICVLVGEPGSAPEKVHTCMDAGGWGDEPWNRWFLVTDSQILTDNEKQQWFGNNPGVDYAFLGRNNNAVTSNGLAENDLLDVDECDYITFIEKFAEADQE